MNRKVVTAALALFILVNLYFLSQSSLFTRKPTTPNKPQPNPANPPKKDDNKGTPNNGNNNVDNENENKEEENPNNEENENNEEENPNNEENENEENNNNNEDDEENNNPNLFEPTAVKPLNKHYKLCIGVHSARSYHDKRSSIRQSWLKTAKPMENVLVRFTVGDQGPAEEDPAIATDLSEEVKEMSDIALLPMVDTYNNLTRKTATWLWWTAHMHAQGYFSCEYVMKTDDDTWVNVAAIVDRLKDKPKEKMVYAYWRGPENVHRGGKWGEPDWPVDKYPKYPHAAGYVLSSDLATFLGNAFMDGWLKPYANEDANMGIWLSMVRHTKVDESDFYGTHCYDRVLALYGQTPEKIMDMSKNFEKCGKPCRC